MMGTKFSRHVSRFLRDRGGNFAIMTAIAIPVLAGSAGVAVDMTNMMMSRSELQEATDAAALAAATALANGGTDTTGAPQLAKDFVAGQMANFLGSDTNTINAIKSGTNANVQQTITSGGTSYAVTVSSSYSMPVSGLTHMLGWNTVQVGASSSTTSGTTQTRTALSMMLALDESGSMADPTDVVASQTCAKKKNGVCTKYNYTYVSKIQALKTAAGALFDALDTADPTHVLVRTGAVSYTSTVMGQTKNPTMNWGTTAARAYVNGMPSNPQGGTDATGAMTIADAAAKKSPDGTDTETIQQATKGNKTSDRFIILMTDGEMTGNSSTWNKTLDQSVRDKCTAAKADGITIFSVAFMAPADGKSLLQFCASNSSNYYDPDTMENLVSAFKSIAQTATSSATLLTN
jgi:Flp pilus assembly protein TadG